jgi:hypothetical protein
MEPIDRQRFAPDFLARWDCSRLLGDGLVHAFSPKRSIVRMSPASPPIEHNGWATFCVSSLGHAELPGAPVPKGNVTCVACISKT